MIKVKRVDVILIDCSKNAQVPLNTLHNQPTLKPYQGKDTLHMDI